MKVKFKGNTEPCIVYEVKNDKEVIEYDEVQGKYCPCIEVEVLGFVSKELLTEATDHPENIPAIDLAVKLSNS